MADKALEPMEQRNVEFYGDELTAVRLEDGVVYVSIRHMTDALGIDAQAQTRRINRNDVLSDGFMVAKMTTIKGDRPANWLRVDLVPLWLSGVSTKSVNDEARPKLKRFQREAAKVLWEAFQDGRLTADPDFEALLAQDTPEAQAVHMARAMLRLANNQLIMRGQLDDHEGRLEAIEATLGDPGRHITPDQAMQISQAVKTVAMKLSKASGRNEYGGVYGELYRKFGITSYKQMPVAKFDEAMAWLNEWRESAEGDIPF